MQLFELMTLDKIEEITKRNYLKIHDKIKRRSHGNDSEKPREYVRNDNHIANPLFARILGVKALQAWIDMARN
jgi:hypothetical protein